MYVLHFPPLQTRIASRIKCAGSGDANAAFYFHWPLEWALLEGGMQGILFRLRTFAFNWRKKKSQDGLDRIAILKQLKTVFHIFACRLNENLILQRDFWSCLLCQCVQSSSPLFLVTDLACLVLCWGLWPTWTLLCRAISMDILFYKTLLQAWISMISQVLEWCKSGLCVHMCTHTRSSLWC